MEPDNPVVTFHEVFQIERGAALLPQILHQFGVFIRM